MLRCGNAGTASTALNDQLREDPARNLLALYQPTGVADRNSRASLDALLKGAERIRASAHSLRNDTAGDDCSWLMALDLTWTNAFGQPRQRSLQIRLEFDVASGTPRVKRVFALTGL